MTNIVIPTKPKANSTTGATPTTSSLALGELGLNTYDGKLFAHINNGTDVIVQLAGPTVLTGDISGSGYGNVTTTLASVTTAGTYSKVTINAKGLVTTGAAIASGDVTTALGFTPVSTAVLGAASGVATLDGSSKLTASQLPASVVGAVVYQGTWNASTNTPTLASGTGTKGQYYKVSTAGTTTLDGISSWNAGDTAIFDGNTYDKIDGVANEVLSVAGFTGVVTLATSNLSDVTYSSLSSGQVLQYNGSKWVNFTLPATSSGTVTSVSSVNNAISVATASTTPSLTFNPGNVTLSTLGGSLTVGQITASGTNGYVLTTTGSATAWAAPAVASVNGLTGTVTGLAPLASPTFTGTVSLGTATATAPAQGDSSTSVPTTAWIVAALASATGGSY